MRGINEVVGFLLCFCSLRTAYVQSQVVNVQLEENRKQGHQVYSLQLPATNEIYTFFAGQDAASREALTLFRISERGVITTTKPIIYEIGKKNYYDLVAIKRNRGDKEGGVPTSIRITITDTNNFSPTFPRNLYFGRVKEDSPLNTVVLGLENCFAEDRDTGGITSYSISSGNEKGYFKAEMKTVNNRNFLVLKTTNVPIVMDTTPEINITVRASDGVRYGTTKVSVTIIDVNNNAPEFEANSYAALINQDAPLLTSVLRVRASDKDLGTNGGIYYYIVNSEYFVVDPITGVVKVVRQLPNEVQEFNVIAQDRGTPTKRDSVAVNIKINGIADYPPPANPNPGINTAPVFPEENYSANVREDFPTRAALLVIHAVDRDPPGPNRQLTYSLSGDSTNAFEIDQNSGVVKLKGPLDYDKKKQYKLSVHATDKGVSPQSSTAALTINVQQVDKNRNPPIFQPSSEQQRRVSIKENMARGTQVGSLISAIDADGSQGPDGQVVYSISSGSGLPYFSIDKDSGRLVTAAILDHEKQAQYDLLLEARDKALYPLYSHLYLMIDVSPEEDNNPAYSQPVYIAKVPEKAPAGTFVTRVHATDKDGVAVSYSLNNFNRLFQIQADSGVITTLKLLDPTVDQTTFTLYIKARAGSGGQPSDGQVNVSVVSKEDSPPTFQNDPYAATVLENMGPIPNLLCIAANDFHGRPVSYSIPSGFAGKFSMDRNSGRFSATGSFDYESVREYPIQAQASSGPQQVTSAAITITVTDAKDPPKFSKNKFVFTLNELTPSGTSRGLVITDEDTNWKQFACTIENIRSVDIVNHFKAILDSGECKLVTQSTFDHFKTPKFTFEVRATDTNNRNMYASAEVEFVIEDTNNNAPVFSQSSYWASVSSNFPVRNSILKISATDKDSGSFGEITYELLDSNDRSRFSLDSTSGVLSSATSLAPKRYQLQVQASDRAQKASEIKRTQVSVVIFVYNPGDTPVSFDPQPTSYTVAENSNVNTLVFDANAKGPSGITYSIVGGNEDNAFQINANNGQVTVKTKESLDREVKETYSLVIRATASDRAAEATATIKLTDINDVTPRIMFMEQEPKHIAIEDFSPKGAFVIQVFAIDHDTGAAGTVKYSITTPSTPFQIDQNTGVITTNREIKRTERQAWDINVKATDGGGRASPAYSLKIHVTDGQQAPQLTPTIDASIDEDAKVGFVVTRDVKPTPNSPNYKYAIVDGNTNEAFCINHAGVISVAKPLDREKISSYVLKVSVSVGNKISNTTVTVKLLDRNDGVPTFTKTVYSFDVSEDKSSGQEVGKVSATDRDDGRNGLVEYRLLYTEDKNSPFQVNQDSGSITTTGPLDFEQIQQHVLYIQSTDKGSPARSSMCKVIFNVKDVNDEVPKFSADSYVSKVALDKAIGAQVLLVTATDLDMIGSDNSRVVYNITSGNDEGAFMVDPDTGAIKVKKSLTTVSASQFSLVVEAKDKGNPAQSSSANVQLNVFLPDGPPKFVVKPVIQEVTEGITANNRVMVVKAATSEALTYEIISGNEDGLFRIVPSTGEIMMTRVLDYEEKKQHQLVVRVMDTRDRSDQVTVILNVKNINDNKPKFPGEDGGLVERKVEDDFQIGDSAARLSAFDEDDGDSISYTLSPNAQSLFSIDSNGFLIAKKPRKEISSPVKFELTAKDSGNPPHETKVQVRLVFVSYRGGQQPVRAYIREDMEVGSVIATVPRYFPGGTLSIIFPQKSNFTVDNSGKIRMIAPFDFEQTQFYSLTVREQEPAPGGRTRRAIGGRTNDVDVEINVVDINDNKPKMTMVDFFGRVNTNSRPGTSAYQLKAEDTDGGLSGRVGYQVVSRGVPFGINPLTEVVETVGILQDIGGYNVTVFPFDYGIPRQFGAPVYLDIKTVNFKPQFSESTYKFEVFEKAPPGVVIGTVKATSASGARLGYAISQGDTERKFNIDSTGELKLNSLLDRETQAMYNLKVKATELIPRNYSNEVDVQITVRNANEYYPSFTELVYVKSVNEGVGAGFSVLRVAATDCDCAGCKCQSGLLKFSLEGTTLFRIDPISGDITVGPNPLDYEKERQHTFTVVVEDFGEKKFKSRSFVRLTVQNTNDEEPQFQQSDYTIGIAEDAVTGKALAAILARDADGSPVSYSITSGNSDGFFKIDSSSGVLSLQQSVKGRTQTQYTLHVRATDTGSAKFDEVRVVVNIEDSNDNRPVFTYCPKEVYVEENKNAGEKVVQVTAVDTKDRGRNKEIEYTLIYGGDTLFQIDNTTGLITTVKSLDRETKDEHTVIVQAEDGGHGRKEAERLLSYCRIDIRVEDTNDNYPIFLTGQYYGSVWQGSPVGTTVLTISAADRDAIGKNNVDNAKVEYLLVNPDDKFRVDPNTGAIITKTDMKNFRGEVQLQIRATNTQPMATIALPPDKTETTVDIKVEVLKPPVFTKPVYTSNVKENVVLDTTILTITANSERNNKMSYSLVKSDQEGEQKFKVDPNDGVISTASTLDYEQRKEYRLQFKAEEAITELSTFCDVIIRIDDVNDDSPTFKLAEYNARVPENAAPGFDVITIEADDRDTGVSGQVSYSLDQQQYFAINSDTGVVTTKVSFDRENPEHNLLTVTAQDKGTPPLKAEASVKVKIVDQNDQPPIFPKARYETKVPENAAIGSSILDLTATDADIGDNARLDYFVSSGDSSQNFRMETVLSPQNYGILTLDGKLDYETKKTYTIKVTATDRKDSATVDVVITVIDTNDNVPQFASLIYEAPIPEDSGPGSVITVSATDADSPNIQQNLQYSLDATGQRYFAINADNGQIITANEKLDREKDQIVSFYVYAYDGKHKGSALVRVTLGDKNDNAPYFPNPPYVGYVEENLNPGASVMVLQAVDLDIGTNAEIVYNLEDSANNKFKIDGDSGLVTTHETLEKETAVNEFTIRVKATDKGNPPLSGTVTVTIKVADGNDKTPVFNPTVYNAKVPEDALPGYFVTKVTATDEDEGANAQLEYTITAGNDPYEFYINPGTGAILVSGLLDFDHGNKSYNLTVMVSDQGVPPKQAVKPAFVYITVLDSNDNPPVFVPAEYNKKVTENLKPGETVLSVTAVDQDTATNAQFTFAITAGDDADMFAIRPNAKNASIGEIYTLLQLDRETVPQYNLTITATDTGGLQGFALVRLTLTDYNDNGPWFVPRYYEGTVKASINQEQVVTTLRAYDPDEASNGSPFTFSVETHKDRFAVRDDTKDPDTADVLFSKGTFNRLVKPFWEVKIKAVDSGSPRMSNETWAYIQVIDDKNSNEPFDGSLTIIVNAKDGKFAGGVIGNAYYRDKDYQGDKNKYTMNSQDFFTVNEGNGNITAEANVPMGEYNFNIDVVEQKQRSGNFPKTVTSKVTVIVQRVDSAAVQQSVALQILALRKPAFFVAGYYFSLRKALAGILSSGNEDFILIFSIQKAPSSRVPIKDVFGLEIQFAVKIAANSFMDRAEVLKLLLANRQTLISLGLNIGKIGIDVCAYEKEQVGKCINKVEASSQYTVVSGYYGQLVNNDAPSSSLTVVSMDITLKAEYVSVIPPNINCSTGNPCLHGGTCHNAVPSGIICECLRNYRGPECQSTTRTFKGNSYLHIEKLIAYERSVVQLMFITGTANGLLLYQGPLSPGANNGLPDVMALMMVEGFVKLVITLGPHPNAPLELYMNKGSRLDDKTWHTVQIIRELKKVTLRIDKCSQSAIVEDDGQVVENRENCEITGEIWGSSIYLDGFGPLQIGGVKNSDVSSLFPKINFAGFQGCIRDIWDNGLMYDLFNPLEEKNTELGCKLADNACPDCNNKGYCEPRWVNSICVCDLGYSGVNCNKRTSAVWYKANSFTQYKVRQSRRKRRDLVPPPVSIANEFYTNIALHVRISPNSSNVVVFLASNSLGTEFNRIDVKNHVLRYVFRLGNRMKILKIPQLNITDDKYHTVIVRREGNQASLQIDYNGRVEGTTGGLHKLLNMGGGSFFTGGLPNITEVRVVEAFVSSGGNAILRTADGNIISSGVGSGFGGFGTSNAAFAGSWITVGARGQVSVSSAAGASVSLAYPGGVRGLADSRGRVFIGRTGKQSYKQSYKQTVYSGSGVSVRVISTSYSRSGKVVISSSSASGSAGGGGVSGGASGGSGGVSGGSGGASGGAGGGASGGASGGSGSGGSGVSGGASGGQAGTGGVVTGASVLGSAASMGTNGAIGTYGSGFGVWTLSGATANEPKEVQVIGDFGGCTAANNYNGVDLDSDSTIEALRQNVVYPCPCSSAELCLHGGTCVGAAPPYCDCPPGWAGPRCENIVTAPKPGTRPGSRWANPAVIACILVIILAILIIIGAVLLKRRPEPTVVAVVEDGHVHDNVRPYHDEGAGEEDNFGYDITTLMKYTYVENGTAGAGGAGYGKFKNGGSSNGEEEFTVSESKPLLQGAMPGAGLHHGVTTITKRRVVHPDSIDVKQFIDTRVHEADSEYILSIDELHIYRYEGDDSDVDDLSELGDSDEEPDEEEEQEFAFLQEWGRKFDNLNHIFNDDD